MINYVGNTNGYTIGDPVPRVNYGWTCPKCNKVWNPSESGCKNCNQFFPPANPNPYTPYTPTPMVPIEPFDFPMWSETSNVPKA